MPKKDVASEIKVRLPERVKALFQAAADRSYRSLNQWLIHAGEEQAKREGVALSDKKGAR